MVLQHITQSVNYIRLRAFNHRLFKMLSDEMGSDHTVLTFHTEERWLPGSCFFFAETCRSFFAETSWSLKHFGHVSHSCIKNRRNSVF